MTRTLLTLVLACLGLSLWKPVPAAAAEAAVAVHARFEAVLESATEYEHPLQQASLTATFTSPDGEKRVVPGFWDGGRTWRVRFAPGRPGRWTYETRCSDTANRGLHNQSGSFTAGPVPAGAGTRLARHGGIRVSADGRYFVHEDGTPFFWMGDTAWNGPLLAGADDWAAYVKERARQKFSVVQFVTTQWRAAPDGDADRALAYTGREKMAVNPAFFRRLDGRVEALNQAGLVAAPVLLWAIGAGANPSVNPGQSLPEDQAILLARYMVARWGGNAVAWMLGGDGDYRGDKAEKWRRIGRGVFGDIAHAPVTMHPGGQQWVWSEFIEEKWYGFVGYQSGHGDGDGAWKWLLQGPAAEDWMKLPHRPFVNLEPPYENHLGYQSKKPLTADTVRRSLYWSLLNAPTAGVTYGGHGVWGWDDGTRPPTDHAGSGTPLPWRKALTMPAAEQVAHVVDFFTSVEWWKLRPAPLLPVNPGAAIPAKHVTGAKSDDRNLCVLYIPEDRTVEVKLDLMPTSPNVTWFNPRTGEKSPAVAVVTQTTCQFPTPAEGDWILFMTMEKKEAEPAKAAR
ncbi:MAG: hypothetical protein RJA22_3060 [Verrucomicrobiota bacterium]|jgi:hypothetical protein